MGFADVLILMGLALWFWIAGVAVVFGGLLVFFALLKRILAQGVEEVMQKAKKGAKDDGKGSE